MSSSDRYRVRKVVAEYRLWCDEVRLAFQLYGRKLTLTEPIWLDVCCTFRMPSSWTPERRKALGGTYHTGPQDASNILKGVEDALFLDDRYVADTRCVKRWCRDGENERTIICFGPIPRKEEDSHDDHGA